MIRSSRAVLGATVLAAFCVAAQALPTGHPAPTIRQTISESRLVTLTGNTRPEATATNDAGILADRTPMQGMLLQLTQSSERAAALDQYIADLHNPKSPNFHQWLSPEQFAEHYGVAAEDVAAVTSWLQAKGFTVDGVAPTGLTIEFSGTAGQVRSAFRTEIHQLNVNGAKHFANMSDPQIPAALQSVVTGIVSLHDFFPKPKLIAKGPHANYTYNSSNGPQYALAPGDLATIYNLNPLFAAGISGKGQTIMLIEDSLMYTTTDWTIFRKTFGLSRAYPYATLSQINPTGSTTCTNPGVPANGTDAEATLDVEWATAAAPNATIVLAACKDSGSTFGGLIALNNVLNGPAASLPSVVSISYGEAEATNGATANAAYKTAYQQAVAEGVSIFVSSGDELAASADNGNISTHGIGISGFASTAYNVAVGGTDFGFEANGVDPSTYFSATNSSTYSSALSYIQEIPWNASCGSPFMVPFVGSCASQASGSYWLNAFGGSGGPSGCATGTRQTSGVVGGTCAGYPKPSWQTVVGNPSDNVRDIPDVSLFASNGIFGSYYLVCWSNPNSAAPVYGGYTCTGTPSTWAGFGGTSVSSPIMAAMQALVNQKTGSRWGNPNTVYYAIASAEYGATGSSTCNSNTVNKNSNSCVFYDVTQGDIVAACKGSGSGSATLRNCYRPTGTYGSLSTSNTTQQDAYDTGTGWDFATGLGTVNAYNLVMSPMWATP